MATQSFKQGIRRSRQGIANLLWQFFRAKKAKRLRAEVMGYARAPKSPRLQIGIGHGGIHDMIEQGKKATIMAVHKKSKIVKLDIVFWVAKERRGTNWIWAIGRVACVHCDVEYKSCFVIDDKANYVQWIGESDRARVREQHSSKRIQSMDRNDSRLNIDCQVVAKTRNALLKHWVRANCAPLCVERRLTVPFYQQRERQRACRDVVVVYTLKTECLLWRNVRSRYGSLWEMHKRSCTNHKGFSWEEVRKTHITVRSATVTSSHSLFNLTPQPNYATRRQQGGVSYCCLHLWYLLGWHKIVPLVVVSTTSY